jgi:uncharacterized protein (TIGR03000 family)
MFLQRIFMLAAVSTGTPIGGSPAPAVTCPPADVEAAHRLAVPPCLYGRDNFPGEVPFPHVRDGVQEQTTFPSQAVLTIRLPPDADLYCNTFHIRSASNRRTFVTVDLCPDHIYYYDLKVRVVRDFRPYTQFQRVVFRPGEAVVVSFGDLGLGIPFAPGWH